MTFRRAAAREDCFGLVLSSIVPLGSVQGSADLSKLGQKQRGFQENSDRKENPLTQADEGLRVRSFLHQGGAVLFQFSSTEFCISLSCLFMQG